MVVTKWPESFPAPWLSEAPGYRSISGLLTGKILGVGSRPLQESEDLNKTSCHPFAGGRSCLHFVKNEISVKHNKSKCNKMRVSLYFPIWRLWFGFRIPFERPFDIFAFSKLPSIILRIKNVCFPPIPLCVLVSLEVNTVRFLTFC